MNCLLEDICVCPMTKAPLPYPEGELLKRGVSMRTVPIDTSSRASMRTVPIDTSLASPFGRGAPVGGGEGPLSHGLGCDSSPIGGAKAFRGRVNRDGSNCQ